MPCAAEEQPPHTGLAPLRRPCASHRSRTVANPPPRSALRHHGLYVETRVALQTPARPPPEGRRARWHHSILRTAEFPEAPPLEKRCGMSAFGSRGDRAEADGMRGDTAPPLS